MDNLLQFGEIKGFLDCFSYINNKTNHGFYFQFDLLGNSLDYEILANKYLSVYFNSYKLHEIVDYTNKLESTLDFYLFKYLDKTETNFLKDDNNNFSMSVSTFRKELLSELINKIINLVEPIKAFWVEGIGSKGFYACEFEDILLIGKDKTYRLHLSWSD